MSAIGSLHEMAQSKVTDYTKDGKCSCCGNCCGKFLPMTKDELKAIKKYVRKHHIQRVVHPEMLNDFTCPFRSETGEGCLIYAVRPLVCRQFICSKPIPDIEKTKSFFSSNKKFTVVNLREEFKAECW